MEKNERRIVLIVDPDKPQAVIEKLHALKAEGYRVENIPADAAALIGALLADNDEETFQRGDYGTYFATLPRALQDSVTQRWGAPERDPAFRESRLDCGAFTMRAARCGNVIVAVAPPRGQPPSHGALAFYAWISDGLRAQAIVNLATDTLPDGTICAVPPLA
ncbi:MAG TPA: cobaltochelatase subunit CobN [Stellaceae bacterium]|jgi:cobaltochelatase CobN|nr:cobaltochelatase subunit CobN [Stellaceae bacterium]